MTVRESDPMRAVEKRSARRVDGFLRTVFSQGSLGWTKRFQPVMRDKALLGGFLLFIVNQLI